MTIGMELMSLLPCNNRCSFHVQWSKMWSCRLAFSSLEEYASYLPPSSTFIPMYPLGKGSSWTDKSGQEYLNGNVSYWKRRRRRLLRQVHQRSRSQGKSWKKMEAMPAWNRNLVLKNKNNEGHFCFQCTLQLLCKHQHSNLVLQVHHF